MTDDRKYIYIRVRLKDAQDLHRQIKVAAAKAGKTIGEWAAEALVYKLQSEDKEIADNMRDHWKHQRSHAD